MHCGNIVLAWLRQQRLPWLDSLLAFSRTVSINVAVHARKVSTTPRCKNCSKVLLVWVMLRKSCSHFVRKERSSFLCIKVGETWFPYTWRVWSFMVCWVEHLESNTSSYFTKCIIKKHKLYSTLFISSFYSSFFLLLMFFLFSLLEPEMEQCLSLILRTFCPVMKTASTVNQKFWFSLGVYLQWCNGGALFDAWGVWGEYTFIKFSFVTLPENTLHAKRCNFCLMQRIPVHIHLFFNLHWTLICCPNQNSTATLVCIKCNSPTF